MRSVVTRCRYILVLVAMFGFYGLRSGAAAAPRLDNCSDICGPDADCGSPSCVSDDDGPIITCGDYDGGSGSGWCDGDTCGGTCGPDADCGQSCYSGGSPTDCGDFDGGADSGWCDGPDNTCDGICGSGASCTTSCTSGGVATTCGDFNGGEDNSECYGYCGDGVCEGDWENTHNCFVDCHYCGDGMCSGEFGEDCSSCSTDCGSCPPGGSGGTPGSPDGCDSGSARNGQGYCCEVGPNYSTDNAFICAGCSAMETCVAFSFDGFDDPTEYACIPNGPGCDGIIDLPRGDQCQTNHP